jgi:hypothetical protein
LGQGKCLDYARVCGTPLMLDIAIRTECETVCIGGFAERRGVGQDACRKFAAGIRADKQDRCHWHLLAQLQMN